MKAFVISIFAFIALNGYAETISWWERIYESDAYLTEDDAFEYCDQSFFSLNTLSIRQGTTNALQHGETYLLKVTYDNNVDSCYAVYNYVPESYEVDGFWTYENNGFLASDDGYMGIYNIQRNAEPFDEEDYPDEDEDFYTWMNMCEGSCFIIETTGISSSIKIEILEYKEEEI